MRYDDAKSSSVRFSFPDKISESIYEASSKFRPVIKYVSTHSFLSFFLEKLKTLTSAVRTAKSNAANAQAAASGARKSLQEKEELLEAARRRADELSSQLRTARQDLVNTNRAAAKANASAHEAKANAARNKRRLAGLRRMRAARLSAAKRLAP